MAATSSSASSKISLKLLVDNKAKKVLFAEANKEFVDFLFHILSLPVGTVIKLLTKNSMVGSLGCLYDSVKNLSDTYMQPNSSKDSVLNPKIANYGGVVPLLPPNNHHDAPTAKKFYKCAYCASYVADDPTAICPQHVTRMKEIGSLEEKVVSMGMEEGLMLLKASFECKNVLTKVFMA